MIVVDTHCDTIETLEAGAKSLINPYNMSTEHIQFVALFTDRPSLSPQEAWELLESERQLLAKQLAKNPEGMALCRTAKQMREAVAAQKKAVVFSMEGACALDGLAQRFDEVYDDGMRCIAFTWNQNNRYACAQPFNGTPQDTGLSEEGRELMALCNRRHVLIDVSHASDQTCLDILHTSKLPVIASHSNFREVCPHNRNLTREQALGIKASGGMVGFNLCASFLSTGKVSMESLLPHLEYGLELLGEDYLGFGFDIDGIDSYPEGLRLDASIHEQYIEFLLRRNYAEATVRKLAGENYLRLFERVLLP